MLCCWVSTYTHGQNRLNEHVGQRRSRYHLPRLPWLSELLETEGLAHTLQAPVDDAPAILGIVVLEVGLVWNGYLTPPSRQSRAMFNYFKGPSDGLVLHVKDYYSLRWPVYLQTINSSDEAFPRACIDFYHIQ